MKTYRETMDELRFTEQEKEAMVDRLLERGGSSRKGLNLRRAAVAVAAAAVLTVGAGAAVVLTPAGEVFASVLGGAPAQTEILDWMGVPVGASDTHNGVTITADAIIGDAYSYAVVYSIAREDGQPLAEDLEPLGNGVLPLTFDRADTSVGVTGGSSHGSAYFYDADPSEPSIQYVEKMTSDVPLEPGTATASFRNLYRMGKDFQDKIPVAEGKWKIRFQFSFPDSSVRLPGGQTFQLNGMEAVLDGVTISPLSIQVDYTVKEELVWDNQSQENGRESEHDREQSYRFFESLPLSLNMADGSTVDLSSLGGSIDPETGRTVCRKGGIFEEILDLSTVESVTVAGITLPVTP